MAMRFVIASVALATVLTGCSNNYGTPNATQAQRPSDSESDAYMRAAENAWAVAPVSQRRRLLKRILSDDYIGVGSKGAVRNKEQTIAADSSMPSDPGESAKLDYVHYRHFGDTVLAQGEETTSSSGRSRSVIWTEVWMFREGKRQIVASQEGAIQPLVQ